MAEELKDSGTVTAMSVVGFVFGMIGMIGSFLPFIGSFAFFIGIPATIVSGIAVGIAKSRKAKQSFAIAALTISLIGIVISGWQYFSIISMTKQIDKEVNRMINNGQEETRKDNEREGYSITVIDPSKKK